MEHICILIVKLSQNRNLKNEINLYNKFINLFFEKNKKSIYLIKQIYDMSDDIDLKKNIIKDLISSIEKNEDAISILKNLLSLEKDKDKNIEIFLNFGDELEKIIICHITDENYGDFIDKIFGIIDNENIIKII